MPPFQLTAQQKTFFNTFGYLVLPGLFADSIDEVTRAFHEVWERRGHVHNGKERSAIVPFIDQHERLSALLDDPRIEAIAGGLLGEDFNYIGSDGNFYVGDTRWHCDSWHERNDYIKIAFYLDPVRRDSGALRVIPGSHLIDRFRAALGPVVVDCEKEIGIPGKDVPAAALESNPGDVVAFHHTALHASYGGSKERRMFTIDVCRHYPDDDITDLRNYLKIFARKGSKHMYGEMMMETASPRRRRHLEQVIANVPHVPEFAGVK